MGGGFDGVDYGILLHNKSYMHKTTISNFSASAAGASLQSGQVELLLHRRLTVDDKRGVSDPLNERLNGCKDCDGVGLVVRGVHHLSIGLATKNAAVRRRVMNELHNPTLMFFGPVPSFDVTGGIVVGGEDHLMVQQPEQSIFFTSPNAAIDNEASANKHSLPHNVHLQTLMRQDDGTLLVRLAHMFEVDEDDELGRDVEVDLHTVLKPFVVTQVGSNTCWSAPLFSYIGFSSFFSICFQEQYNIHPHYRLLSCRCHLCIRNPN